MTQNSVTNLVSFDTFVVMLLESFQMQDIIFITLPLRSVLLLEASLTSHA